MDSAARKVSTNASTVLISGLGAPARTAMPVTERARSTRVAVRRCPVAARSSNALPLKISRSAVSPRSSRTGMDSGPPPMEEPYSVITSIPVACANIGPRMLKAAVKPPEVITLTCCVSLVGAVRPTESCAVLGYATTKSTARENKTDTDDRFIACRATARCRGVRCAGSGPRTRGGSRREVRCRRSPSCAPGLSDRRCIRPTPRANRLGLPPPRAVRHRSD